MTGELFEDEKEGLDSQWHDVFDELVGQGFSPSGIKGTVEYISTEKTQAEAAREFGTSKMTIRKLQHTVIALGPEDHVLVEQHEHMKPTAEELCHRVADEMDWKRGEEYSISANQPNILKQGWKSLYNQVVDDE